MKPLIGPLGLAIAMALSPQSASGQAVPSAPVAPIYATRISNTPVRFADLPPPRHFVTHHKTMIRGKPFSYVATAGETVIASIFSFAYLKGGHPNPARPVLCVFNGGPGSSPLWLHIGALGPRRVVLDREINPSNVPPFGLKDNPDTPLDTADLVFIDPVAFSHELLADRGLDIGLYDSRYTLPSANAGGDIVADDPAMAQYVPGLIAAFNDLIGNDLRVDMHYPYGAIVWEWPYTGWTSQRAGVFPGQDYAQDLATAMRRNLYLRLMVATGYYDLLTTPAAAESQVLRRISADRVTFHSYEARHMLYLGGTAARFSDDVRKFIRASHS